MLSRRLEAAEMNSGTINNRFNPHAGLLNARPNFVSG